jgi:hypothetical protein
MNRLLSIKKCMAISVPVMLALVIPLSTSESAMGQKTGPPRAGMYPLRQHNNKAPPIPPNWRPSWTRISTPISTFVSRIPIHNRSPSST